MSAPTRERERGQALALFALSITVLLGMASLAIDVGRLLSQQRYLQNATDAAALAAAKRAVVLASSGSSATIGQVRTAAAEILSVNLAHSPAGAPAAVPLAPVFAGTAVPTNLVEGILFTDATGTALPDTYDVRKIVHIRVAARSRVDFLLARSLGIEAGWTFGRAHVGLKASVNLMPLAVRRYVGGTGPNTPTPVSCPEDPSDQRTWFFDLAASYTTACLGGVDAISPSGYDGRSPASLANPGPIMELLGQGAQASSGGVSFRGFINLDVRDYRTEIHRYYNGLTATSAFNATKAKEAAWVAGYPGPQLGAVTVPSDGSNQVGILDGNSAGMIVAEMDKRFDVDDVFLAALYDGTVRTIPAFLLREASAVAAIPTTGGTRTGTFLVEPNRSFDDYVQLSTMGVPAGLTVAVPTTPFAPDQRGTSVTVTVTAGAGPARLDSFWLKGIDTNQPNNRLAPDFYLPVAFKVGTVSPDFTWTPRTPTLIAASDGATIELPLTLSTAGATDYSSGNAVTLRLVENRHATGSTVDPDETMPAGSFGLGSVGTTSATVALSSQTTTTKAQGKQTRTYNGTVTLKIDSSRLPLTRTYYTIPLEMTATTAGGQTIRHLDLIRVNMAAAATDRNYVEIVGFAAYKITAIDANTVWGRIISPIETDPDSSELLIALTPRLIPW